VVIENATPEVDGGRFAVKRIVGDVVAVEADVFADSHDELACRLQYRRAGQDEWAETPMTLLVNDHWRGEFTVRSMVDHFYRIVAWPDRFRTWQRDLRKRLDAGQDIELELKAGTELLRGAATRAPAEEATRLRQNADALENERDPELRPGMALDPGLAELVDSAADRSAATVYDRGQRVVVERERAGFGAWYEMFPRSAATEPGKHGTLRDVIKRLPYVASMGFDVLYLPPVHPIGMTNRKGRNNQPAGAMADAGSPWAIGGVEGGHKTIHPELGTLADFHELLTEAGRQGIEIALDIAFQVSPDHPYVSEHPQWFRHRPDGSIRYAENPPKRYEDIYPIDFETADWQALWQELESVVRFWTEQGVRIFRVDNPHTKPFAFWEWLIARIRLDFPDVIFLAEAFTLPKRMYYLAKLGFSQSYTYFAWRNQKWDLSQYVTELTQTPVREYFRPSFWPNTPDILNEYLQFGGRPAFIARFVLAATLSANYGIYGPLFELAVNSPREPGSEEYLDSEKYEVRHWDLDASWSLRDIITRVNRARRENPALQRNDRLRLLEVNNEQLFAFTKTSADGENIVLVVVNLDPHNTQSGWLRLPLWEYGLEYDRPYQMHDQLDGARYLWRNEWNYVELNPQVLPAHLFRIRRHERREHDFDYFI
jgi:starch synthase (maltosyl-transferring)